MAKDSLFGNVLGFFAIPIGMGIASRLVAGSQADNTGAVLVKSTVAQVAAAGMCFWAAENHARNGEFLHAFLRGGMWGSGLDALLTGSVVTASAAFAPSYLKQRPPPADITAMSPAAKGKTLLGETVALLAHMKAT